MYLFRLFYSFLPLRNPIGFGSSDFIVLAIAVLMVAFLVGKAWLSPLLSSLSVRPWLSMFALAGLAVALRLALLPHSPIPQPSGADDFSYLLLSDTLAHLRLANPMHPMHRFFETVFVLQQPTYASIYPLGPGVVLAAGQWLGSPWIGTLLASGALCAAFYWMLRGWTTPPWALVGGVLACMAFGPLCPWVNSYWGGFVPAIAGCLVFGALPRLRASSQGKNGVLLGAGIGLHMISRPFESLMLVAAVVLYLAFSFRHRIAALRKPFGWAVLPVLCSLVLVLLQNQAVTGHWRTMPYALSRYQYGVPATFTFHPNPLPHLPLTPEQELDYRAQSAIHDSSSYWQRLVYRLRYMRFFFLPPLFFILPAFLLDLRQPRNLWLVATAALFLLGTNFYPYFYPHYVAAIASLMILISVRGLARLPASGRTLVLGLCFTSFVFWYLLYASGDPDLLALTRWQSWNYVNSGDVQGRAWIEQQLLSNAGQQLVFVHYAPYHRFEEWIHNRADLDRSRIVWANDLGREENQKLIHYFPQRKVWLLEPDARPPALAPY